MLREIADYRRFKKLSVQDRSIVFYAEHSGYYPYFEGIIEKLTHEYDRTICYVTSDWHDPILTNSDPRIKTLYLNRLLPFFMAFVDCKVFVMTLFDLGNFHLRRSINPVHYVYVPHGLVSTHMVVRHNAYDHYDCILCTGPHRITEIRRREQLQNLPPKTLVEAGYYRLERIYQDYQDYVGHKPSQPDGETVLIAPSWGADNILESCGEELVELLLREGYRVVVRPHPETIKHAPRLIKQLEDGFGKKPSFTLEKSVVSHDSLLQADILITDWSSISLEYAFGTERPVLFLDVPPKIRNPKWRELGIEPIEFSLRQEVGMIVSHDRVNAVPQAIKQLVASQCAYKKRLAELRNRYVYSFGRSAEIGAKYIIERAGSV
jgi:YidC/Oxa1 family membrane protein insertase